MTSPIFTIGHSTRALEEFIGLLGEAGVELLVDVRAFPRSRRQPQFNPDTMPEALGPAGIGYAHLPALGGRRGKAPGPSPNTGWREEAFRNYADHALMPEFRAGFEELMRLAGERPAAIMCAEALWWQCHRRIVADYLLAAGAEVRHIMGPGKIEPARITPGAVVQADGTVLYPPAQGSLL